MKNFKYLNKIFRHVFLCFLLINMTACGIFKSSEPDLPILTVGLAPIMQPMRDIELLAGYLPAPRSLAYEDELQKMQLMLEEKIVELPKDIQILEQVEQSVIVSTIPENSRRGMLSYWIAFGKHYNIDLLIVPYVYYYNDKDAENSTGQTNALMINFFLIDVRHEGKLLQRTHFAEEEQSLDGDMLGMRSFIKRQGKTSITDMLNNAYDNMIKEFELETLK